MAPQGQRPEILVFEADAKSALPVAESFARRGFRVVAASSRRYCAAFYSRAVRERVRMPSEMARPDECRDFLLDLVRRRRFEMIVPLGDIVSHLVCSRRNEFMRHARLVLVPPETFRLGRDKIETMKAAEACGIPLPRTWYPHEQSLDRIAREVDYPVLVKPAIANGARGIHLVRDAMQLAQRYEEVCRSFGRTFVQEFIPHEGMQYKADLILDRDGTRLAGVVYNKIRFYPPTGGSSVLNMTVEHAEILEYATRIAQHMKWFGLCDFDFIHDVRDNKPKIMEINPRFPESFRICEAAGIDFTEILHRMARGEQVEPISGYRIGRYLRFLPGDLMWMATAKGRRRRHLGSWLRFFDRRTTYQILSRRDPGPMMGYILENLALMLNREERRFRFRLDAASNRRQPG